MAPQLEISNWCDRVLGSSGRGIGRLKQRLRSHRNRKLSPVSPFPPVSRFRPPFPPTRFRGVVVGVQAGGQKERDRPLARPIFSPTPSPARPLGADRAPERTRAGGARHAVPLREIGFVWQFCCSDSAAGPVLLCSCSSQPTCPQPKLSLYPAEGIRRAFPRQPSRLTRTSRRPLIPHGLAEIGFVW